MRRKIFLHIVKYMKPLYIYIYNICIMYIYYPEIIGEANLFFVKEYIECRGNESSSFYIYF